MELKTPGLTLNNQPRFIFLLRMGSNFTFQIISINKQSHEGSKILESLRYSVLRPFKILLAKHKKGVLFEFESLIGRDVDIS